MAIKKSSKPSKSEQPPKRGLSLAEIWDNTDPSEASNNLPAGEHEVRLNSIELKDDPKKGKAAIITYEAIDGDHEGKTLRQLYKLADPAGGKGPGVAYLMRDLALLGYSDIDGKKLKKTLQEISDEQPMVIINAVENGQYTNAYLQGLPENIEKKDDDEEEEEGSELEVGDKVTGEDDDGNDVTGTIKKINAKKGIATVEDDDEEEYTCDLEGLTKVEEEEEDEDEDEEEVKPKVKAKGKKAAVVQEEEEEESDEIEVGDSVTWEDEDGDEQSGTVKKIKGTKAIVEDDDEDEHTVKLGDLAKA